MVQAFRSLRQVSAEQEWPPHQNEFDAIQIAIARPDARGNHLAGFQKQHKKAFQAVSTVSAHSRTYSHRPQIRVFCCH